MRKYFVFGLVGGAAVAVVACTGDPVVVTPVDGSVADSTVGNDGSINDGSAIDDAANDDGGLVELDGGTIDDAGGDPDPDGGVVIDAGADAGVCGPPSGNSAAITSTCSSLKVLYTGGTIATGTYDLVALTVTGSISYCQSYVPASWSGKLVVTATKGGYRFDERATGKGIILSTNRSYDVASTTTTPLAATQTCGIAINDTSWGYSAGKVSTDAGTRAGLSYEHNLGTAVVRYRWVHQ